MTSLAEIDTVSLSLYTKRCKVVLQKLIKELDQERQIWRVVSGRVEISDMDYFFYLRRLSSVSLTVRLQV